MNEPSKMTNESLARSLEIQSADYDHALQDTCLEAASRLRRLAETKAAAFKDWAETDTNVRNRVRGILTDFEIDGDSFGVPCIEDIVDRLCERVQRLAEMREGREWWISDPNNQSHTLVDRFDYEPGMGEYPECELYSPVVHVREVVSPSEDGGAKGSGGPELTAGGTSSETATPDALDWEEIIDWVMDANNRHWNPAGNDRLRAKTINALARTDQPHGTSQMGRPETPREAQSQEPPPAGGED